MIKTYSELTQLKTFEERYNYLKLSGSVGQPTFGFDRWMNQRFYTSTQWRKIRNEILLRDNGCDLGDPDRPIGGKILIHHMNPVNMKDIMNQTDYLLNPDFLICVSHDTHNAIHYGDETLLPANKFAERTPNDTCPWRK